MNTLIIPCAGKSSRFPDMKPKWLLTHPDGDLMIQKALTGLNLDIFDRIIFTIVREHAEKYEADLVLRQLFSEDPRVEVFILDTFTKSASETICLTLEKMNVHGGFAIKDSDNYVKINIPNPIPNAVVGYDLHKHPEITNVPGKSFIIVNEQSLIQDIIEKRVVSNIVCLGVYCHENADVFRAAYHDLNKKGVTGEMFVSHVISYILSQKNSVYQLLMATGYEDWGTLTEWRQVQQKYKSYFVDVDGVVMKNSGCYGSVNWDNNRDVLQENVDKLVALQKEGAQLVFTTARPEKYRSDLEAILRNVGLVPHAIVMGLNHSTRVLINDFAPTNPYPSSIAISIPRNGSLKGYV